MYDICNDVFNELNLSREDTIYTYMYNMSVLLNKSKYSINMHDRNKYNITLIIYQMYNLKYVDQSFIITFLEKIRMARTHEYLRKILPLQQWEAYLENIIETLQI